jgi:N-acetylglutamate synthase-like GNAT family acetyltransferase
MPACSNERAMPGGLTLRVAGSSDAAAVAAVLAASYGTLYRGWYRDDVLDRALPAMTRANPLLLASGRYFLVEDSGAAISCGGWSFEKPGGFATSRLAHVRHFATRPDHLGRGAASLIIARCFDEARANGAVEIEALSSLAAEAFYAGRGFRPMAHVRLPMGGAAFACVLMRRPLADPARSIEEA